MLAQKKEATFFSLSENAYKAGGLQIIMNIATAGSFCGGIYDPKSLSVGTLGVDMVRVYQIQGHGSWLLYLQEAPFFLLFAFSYANWQDKTPKRRKGDVVHKYIKTKDY